MSQPKMLTQIKLSMIISRGQMIKWALICLVSILLQTSFSVAITPNTCFNQNQYPLVFADDDPRSDFIFKAADVQKDASNNVVFCGEQKFTTTQDYFDPVVGFIVNTAGSARFKWGWTYTNIDSLSPLEIRDCQNIKVSTNRTIVAAFSTQNLRYVYTAIDFDTGKVIRSIILGDTAPYIKRQFLEITANGEVLLLIDQNEVGANAQVHTQIVKFPKDLGDPIWIRELSTDSVNSFIQLSTIILQDASSYIWAAGIYYDSSERNLLVSKLDTVSGTSMYSQIFGSVPLSPSYLNIPQMITLDDDQRYLFGCVSNAQSQPNSAMSFFLFDVVNLLIRDHYAIYGTSGEQFQCRSVGAASDGFQIFYTNEDSFDPFMYTFLISYPPANYLGSHSFSTVMVSVFGISPFSMQFNFFAQVRNSAHTLKYFYVGTVSDLSGQKQGLIEYHYGSDYACHAIMDFTLSSYSFQAFNQIDSTPRVISIFESPVFQSSITPTSLDIHNLPNSDMRKFQKEVLAPTLDYCSVQGMLNIISHQNAQFNLKNPFICTKNKGSYSQCLVEVVSYKIMSCTDTYPIKFQIVDAQRGDKLISAYTLNQAPPYKLKITKEVLDYVSLGVIYELKVITSLQVDGLEYTKDQSVQFLFMKTIKIEQTDIEGFVKIKDQRYIIADQELQIQSNIPTSLFLQDAPIYILDTDFSFESSGSIHYKFLSFEKGSNTIIIHSDDESLANLQVQIALKIRYTFQIGSYKDSIQIMTSFRVLLLSSKLLNTAPFFTDTIPDLTAMCGFYLEYLIPAAKDNQGDPFTVQVKFDEGSSLFSKFDGSSILFSPRDQDEGFYRVTLIAIQNNNQNLFSLQSFTLHVIALSDATKKEYELKSKLLKAREDLKAKISKISNTGILKIQFEKSMYIYANYTQVLNQSLRIHLLQNGQSIELDYEIQDFNSYFLTIKLSFGSLISSISLKQLDSIQVIFKEKNIYFDALVQQKVPQNYKLRKFIQQQISDENWDASNAVAQAIKITMITLFGVSATINVFLQDSFSQFDQYRSQALSSLWGMIEGFQLITHLPMMSINLPKNTLSFFAILNDIVNMNLVDMDTISNAIFDFDSVEYEPFNSYFDFMNYQSTNLIQNLGLLFYAIFLNLMLTALLLLLQLLGINQKQQVSSNEQFFHSSILKRIYDSVVFGSILRFLAESQLELTICSFVNLSDMRFNTSGDIMSSLISLSVVVACLLLPFLSLYVVLRKRSLVKNEKNNQTLNQQDREIFVRKTEVMIENLRFDDRKIYLYALLYWFRRTLYSVIMIGLPNDPQICILLHIKICLLMIVFVQYVNPNEDPRFQKLLIFNEVIFLLTCYCFMPFLYLTDIDESVRKSWGYLPIGLILFYLLFNSVILLVDIFTSLKKSLSIFLTKLRG